MWDLLLLEAVRNFFLGYACCADLFTINGFIITPVHQLVYARSWKPKGQTNIFSPYSYLSTTLQTCHVAVHSVLALRESSSGFSDNHSVVISTSTKTTAMQHV